MLTKIWERYFIKETLKTFFFISFCFYGLYVLIDYASHSGARHHQSMMEWSELIKFYANEWILRADVLVPFALMIATIRTLCDLNIHNELVALQASGISLKKILRPFIFLGLLFTLLIYANTEFLLPNAMAASRHLRNQKEIQKNNKNKKFFVQHVGLKDGSTLLYQHYNFAERSFFDAYWVKSFDEIWRFQHLSPYEQPPKGIGVGHFQRMPDNTLHKIESFESRSFPEMKFNQKILLDTLTPSRELSLSTLWKRLPHSKEIESEKEAEFAASFFHKSALPWLCFFAVIAPAPFCVRYGRSHPIFFIYSLSLFFLVGSYLILNAALIISERQVLSPEVAIGVPFMLFSSTTFYRFLYRS